MRIPRGPKLLDLSTVVQFPSLGISHALLLPAVNSQLLGSADRELEVVVPEPGWQSSDLLL